MGNLRRSCGVVPASHAHHLCWDVGGSRNRTPLLPGVARQLRRVGQPSGGRSQAVPSEPAAPGASAPSPPATGAPRGEFGAARSVALSPGGCSAWCECRCRSSAVGAGRRKPLHRRKPRVNRLRAAPLRVPQNSLPPPLPLLFSFLFFRRCQPWARSPFLPEWGFTPTAGRRWAHFDGGNETTALSLSVRSFHSALARQTLAQGLAWKKWPEIDGIYSFPGLAERSGKNIPESVTEILQSSISGAAISCGRRKMGSTRSYMENKHTGASCQIQLIL